MAHQHTHQHAAETEAPALAELLDLGAEVMHAYQAEVTGWIAGLTVGQPPRQILDLGAGTGAGAVGLAWQFGKAAVIAVDASEYMLERLAARARDLGLAGRIRTLQADLDTAWPAVGIVDLAWASLSLHHLADPGSVLASVFGAIRPGGLLVVAEMDSFPRFLPDDIGIGRPGLEERCHVAVGARIAQELPELGADWGPRLRQAGFAVEAQRHFAIDLTPPLPAAAGRYAQVFLRRLRHGLDDQLSAEDLAALDAVIDGDGQAGVLQRGDLTVRDARTVWVARRP